MTRMGGPPANCHILVTWNEVSAAKEKVVLWKPGVFAREHVGLEAPHLETRDGDGKAPGRVLLQTTAERRRLETTINNVYTVT